MRFGALVLAVGLVVSACGDDDAESSPTVAGDEGAPAGDAVEVDITGEFTFTPDSVTVPVGSTVTWTNVGTTGVPHTTTSNDGLWDSDTLSPLGSRSVADPVFEFSFTFNEAGTFGYFCTFHPEMMGTVVVEG